MSTHKKLTTDTIMIVTSNFNLLVRENSTSSLISTETARGSPQPAFRVKSTRRNNKSTRTKRNKSGARKDKTPSVVFDVDFTPGPFDVICGRGNDAWNHRGNQFLRTLIQHGKKKYGLAGTKQQRSDVVSAIVETIRSKGHGFVKMDNTNHQWYEIGDYLSREKVSQLLRNANADVYRSSTQAKKQRRKESNSRVFCSSHQLLHSDIHVSKIMDAVETKLEQESKDLSDDEVLNMFNQANAQLLDVYKKDMTLLIRFNAVSWTSEVHDDDNSNDEESIQNGGGAPMSVPMVE